MFGWFARKRRKAEDTQPIPVVSPDTISALDVLNEARARRKEAEAINVVLVDKVTQLEAKRQENHFYQSFVTILRTE